MLVDQLAPDTNLQPLPPVVIVCLSIRHGGVDVRVRQTAQEDAVAEATAADLGLPIHIEGYAPPDDPRLNVIRVAPDPGVIEVNIHPATDWREAVAITSNPASCQSILRMMLVRTSSSSSTSMILYGFIWIRPFSS